MSDYAYDNFVKKLSSEFQRELEYISANYNFDYGDEFEIAICKMLRKFLPTKFGITRGFVVNAFGAKAGDDIIIYDQEHFPTLRFLGKDNYSRKEEIPVEAVYAYIEAKHRLAPDVLIKAFEQIQKVKALCLGRYRVRCYSDCDPNVTPFDLRPYTNEYETGKTIRPTFKNPVYTMILARYSNQGSKEETQNMIMDFLARGMQRECINNPDSIIIGNDNTVFPLYVFPGDDPNAVLLTKFYSALDRCQYQVNMCDGVAYGLGLTHLMQALNWIKLSDMPWEDIFNEAKIPNKETREENMAALDKCLGTIKHRKI